MGVRPRASIRIYRYQLEVTHCFSFGVMTAIINNITVIRMLNDLSERQRCFGVPVASIIMVYIGTYLRTYTASRARRHPQHTIEQIKPVCCG